MASIRVSALALTFVLASCTSIPAFKLGQGPTYPPTVADLVNHIQCEIWGVMGGSDGYRSHELYTNRYVAFAQLTVDVTNFEGTAPSLNFISPYANPMENLTKTIGGQWTGTQHRNMSQSFYIDLSSPVSSMTSKCDPTSKEGSRLEGTLGLSAVIESGLRHVADTEFVFKRPDNKLLTNTNVPVFGSTVDFTVVYGLGNVGPTWTLTRFKGPGGGGGGGGSGTGSASGGGSSSGGGGGGGGGAQGLLTLTRTLKDTLVISFAPVTPVGTVAAVAPAAAAPAAVAPAPVTPAEGPRAELASQLPRLTQQLEEEIMQLKAQPKASAAERSNVDASRVLATSSLVVAQAVSALQQQADIQAQSIEALRQALPSPPSPAASAAKAAEDNNTRMILQNLLNSQ